MDSDTEIFLTHVEPGYWKAETLDGQCKIVLKSCEWSDGTTYHRGDCIGRLEKGGVVWNSHLTIRPDGEVTMNYVMGVSDDPMATEPERHPRPRYPYAGNAYLPKKKGRA